jgi:hypothetical protein
MAISRALLALTVLLVVAAPAARACVGLRAVVTNTGAWPRLVLAKYLAQVNTLKVCFFQCSLPRHAPPRCRRNLSGANHPATHPAAAPDHPPPNPAPQIPHPPPQAPSPPSPPTPRRHSTCPASPSTSSPCCPPLTSAATPSPPTHASTAAAPTASW